MRISDWSSDVCSSDLGSAALRARLIARRRTRRESVSPRRSGRGRSRACAAARRYGRPRRNSRRRGIRSEEHTSELQSLMRISYAVFCLKKKKIQNREKLENKQRNIESSK